MHGEWCLCGCVHLLFLLPIPHWSPSHLPSSQTPLPTGVNGRMREWRVAERTQVASRKPGLHGKLAFEPKNDDSNIGLPPHRGPQAISPAQRHRCQQSERQNKREAGGSKNQDEIHWEAILMGWPLTKQWQAGRVGWHSNGTEWRPRICARK